MAMRAIYLDANELSSYGLNRDLPGTNIAKEAVNAILRDILLAKVQFYETYTFPDTFEGRLAKGLWIGEYIICRFALRRIDPTAYSINLGSASLAR